MEFIDGSDRSERNMRMLSEMVMFKAQVLLKLGYFEDAFHMFNKVQMLISGRTANHLDIIHQFAFADAIVTLECEMGLAQIDIALSKFHKVEQSLMKCEEVVASLFKAKDCDLARRIKILKLSLARSKLDFPSRSKVADELSEIYQNYDHYRLLKCGDFMEFAKERIQYLLDDCKYETALGRVNTILGVLDQKKASYWFQEYSMMKAVCLLNIRGADEAYSLLQEILKESILAKDSKFKDYRLFVTLHLELSQNYYARENFKNALKCLKYIVMEYYQNPAVFKTMTLCNSLDYALLNLSIANINRKMNEFPKAMKYIGEVQKIMDGVFTKLEYNFHYGALLFIRSKILLDMGDHEKADGDLYMAKRIYEECISKEGGDYAVSRLATTLNQIGQSFAKKDKFQSSLNSYKESIALFKKLYPNELNYGISTNLNDIATLCITFDHFSLAEEYLERALQINQKMLGYGQKSLKIASIYFTYGNLYLKQYKYFFIDQVWTKRSNTTTNPGKYPKSATPTRLTSTAGRRCSNSEWLI